MQKGNKSYNKNWFVFGIRIVLIFILLPFVLVWLVLNAVKKHKRKKLNKEKVAIFNMSQIDSLSGEEFEILLKDIFQKLGYEVALTKKSHDYGADLIISKKKTKMLVQAKCYAKSVGVKAIQEIVASRKHYKVDEVIVATNNYFSKDARILAEENNVGLFDRDDLFELIKKFDIHVEVKSKKYVATSPEAKAEIEKRFPFWF